MKAFLVLQDGTVFEGIHIGARKEVISEIVFSTSMGYPEVLTDPSNAGVSVCMTYPLIGNYGVCREDFESAKVWPEGIIVRELSRIPSNFRSECTIQQFLEENEIPGIAGIDTRALTRLLREKGVMNGMITTNEHYNKEEILQKLKEYTPDKTLAQVSCKEAYTVQPVTEPAQSGAGLKVALLDLGVKKSLIHALTGRGCEVTVYPADTKAEEILAASPDGIVLSNGPADPKECEDAIAEIRRLYETEIPMFGMGLGHALMASAVGAKTRKMKNGHRGGNYPVKDLTTGKAIISAQNHGYVVETEGLDKSAAVPAFVNVNDGTNEGLIYTGKKSFSVQFDLADFGYLFDRFISMMKGEM